MFIFWFFVFDWLSNNIPGHGKKFFCCDPLGHALGQLFNKVFTLILNFVFNIKNFLSLATLLALKLDHPFLNSLLIGQCGGLPSFTLSDANLLTGIA